MKLAMDGPHHMISFPISFTSAYGLAAGGCGNGVGNGTYINMNLYYASAYIDKIDIATMTIGSSGFDYSLKPSFAQNLRCSLVAVGY